jgi:hypothetical protein
MTKDEVRQYENEMVSLRDHLEQMIDDMHKIIDSKLAAMEQATALQAAVTKEKFESVNYIRSTLTDQNITFARNDRVDGMVTRLEENIKSLRREIVDSVISKVERDVETLRNDQAELRTFMNQAKGKASQTSVTITTIISITALLIAIAKLFINI